MAIEKMKVVSVIGKLEDFDRVSRLVVLNGSTHILNALSELNSNYLNLSASEEHMQALQEMSTLRPYNSRRDFSKDGEMVKSFHELFDLKAEIDLGRVDISYNYAGMMERLKNTYETVKHIFDKIKERSDNIVRLQQHIENVGYLRNTGLAVDVLRQLRFIKFKLLMLSNENFKKLELNIENVPSVIFQVAAVEKHAIIASFTPEDLKDDAERIFVSLNYRELEIPDGYTGTAEEIIREINSDIEEEKQQIEELKKSVHELKEEYSEIIKRAYVMVELEKQVEIVKSEAALGQNMFFMFGFTPVSELNSLQNTLKKALGDSILLISEDVEGQRAGHAPPTKIKNNILIRPFESLVTMYGIPSYGEKDPTPFFAISYMLLFGAMFGDVGQGLVIFLAGLYANYKLHIRGFGGILSRLGISSAIFGTLYGSLFGAEDVIPAILIRPMANINTMLLGAVVLGIILITIGYIYSFINHYSSKNVEEGVFGKEGVAGFIFFGILVFTIWDKATGILNVSTGLLVGLMAALLLLMVFKQPLAGLLTGHRLYEEKPADYYIEAGFGIIETLLSVTSNIISFIRVGAFALNHVGLYIAFATMAKMINSEVGGIIVLIIGNIIIIGLEGLIVFIQSLRLEYYELFSKYYSGYGVEYRPVSLSYADKANEDIL
ncbi:MAG: V-type ATP synthase subunit I [Caulobacteraceae bacterium]